jgi:hypothetical protein
LVLRIGHPGYVVPIWALLPTFVLGLILGALAIRRVTRPVTSATPPGPEPAAPSPSHDSAREEAAPVTDESLPIGMGDVVSELERRYQGRRVDHRQEKPAEHRPRRKR